jgi:hypothetical protein
MLVVIRSRWQYKDVKEKWPLKYLMFARKCLASASELDHNLMSSGGVSGLER